MCKLSLLKCTRSVCLRLGFSCLVPTCANEDITETFSSSSSLQVDLYARKGLEESCPKHCLTGLRWGLIRTDSGALGGTYGLYSASSVELNRRIDEPLFGMFVGVRSFGVPE